MVVLISLMAVSLGYSYSYTLTKDWGTSTSTAWPAAAANRAARALAFNANAATTHLYILDRGAVAGGNIRIAKTSDGSLIDTDFPTPSGYDRLSTASLGIYSPDFFAIAQADDGAIYGALLSAPTVLIRWANESDVAPTSTTVTNNAASWFARNLNARGAGVNTKIYLSRGNTDNDVGMILTTADGLNFTQAEVIGTLTTDPFGKTDCGVKDSNTIFGIQPWGANPFNEPTTQGFPDRWDKIAAVWTRSATFVPPMPVTPPAAGNSLSTGGDWIKVASGDPRYATDGGLLAYFTYSQDKVFLVNDTTGRVEALPYNLLAPNDSCNLTYVGTIRTDSVAQKIYMAGVNGASSNLGNYARFSIAYVGTGVSDWELY